MGGKGEAWRKMGKEKGDMEVEDGGRARKR